MMSFLLAECECLGVGDLVRLREAGIEVSEMSCNLRIEFLLVTEGDIDDCLVFDE